MVAEGARLRRAPSAPHPATWSQPVLEVVAGCLPGGATVLDPFAGTGGLADIAHIRPVCVELEPEWATQIVGNALALPFASGSFLYVATSPCFGNRMADHHDNRDACKPCKGRGSAPPDPQADQLAPQTPCRACGGSGLSRRHTYKHYLGRDLHPASSAVMQWGGEYRDFHRAAWAEVTRVSGRWAHLILDISDHIRGLRVMPVTAFHQEALEALGWLCIGRSAVDVRRQRHGQNGDLRVDEEWVLEFVRVG
jgi:hypothetical protein